MNTDCKSIRKKTQACDAQAQILAAVDELFYLEGARAVGVEAVVKRAGVNKMSLYRQFESKDALLLEYLKRRNEKYWMLIQASLDKHPDDARKQLQQLFIDFAERSAECTYRGCAFVNIAVEFPDPNHAARLLVAENKKQLLAKLNELAVKAGARDAQLMSSALALLLEGAYTATQTYAAESQLVKQVPAIAAAMIADFCD